MVSYFQGREESESLLQNSIFDALYCEEERFDENVGGGLGDFDEIYEEPSFPSLSEHDLVWEDDELDALLSKEGMAARLCCKEMGSDGCLKTARDEAIKWMMKVIGFYGFNAMTALLAVNYYDRFITSVCFQKDMPWMSQLAAVACLSISAKVEETQVPMLLDLQVEESKYLFEGKTIQRMELLVLSTLQWKMNPVTPISFIDHIVRRFGLMGNRHWEFLSSCENVLLSIIADCRLRQFLPSVIAATTMMHVINEMQICDVPEYEIRLRASKEEIDGCYKLIMDAMDDPKRKRCLKRKYDLTPGSPSGIMDAYFSSDSSVDSWAVAPSVSSSPEPYFKRRRAQDQHMRLAPRSSSVSVGVTSRPH